MFVFYKEYKSSFIATMMSMFATLTFVGGGAGMLQVIFEGETHMLKLSLLLLVASAALYFGAKKVAKEAHIRKLQNDLKYTRDFVEENPDALEVCLQINPSYAEYYYSKVVNQENI